MKYYPVYLDLRERPCVVAGGGRVAERKVLSLLEAGGSVTVVSPSLTLKLEDLSSSGKITHHSRLFQESDLTGAYIVVAATGSLQLNAEIGRSCRKKHILVNVAAPPTESTFIVPSVVDRGALLIAISTSGESPALAKRIRGKLEKEFGPEYDLLLHKMSILRSRLMAHVGEEAERNRILNAVADSDVIELLRDGKMHEADLEIARISGLKQL